MFDKIYFVGFGSVAKAVLEIFNLEDLYVSIPITIIEPLDVPKWIYEDKKRKIKHIKKAIDPKNASELLKGLTKDSILIDLSVNVDSIMLIDICIKHKCKYLNTSLESWNTMNEDWDSGDFDNYNKFKDETLYHRELLLKKRFSKRDAVDIQTDIIVNFGMNPGLISCLCLWGIDILIEEEGEKSKPNFKTKDASYADCVQKLKIKRIEIVEDDTQKVGFVFEDQVFINTWSPDGFCAEAIDPVMVGYNPKDDIFKSEKLLIPNEGENKSVRFIGKRGMDYKMKSITLDHEGQPYEYEGMLIPHMECYSLSNFLTDEEGNRPTVFYCYRCSDAALESLDNFKKNDYKLLFGFFVPELVDIKAKGYDSIGCLFTFYGQKKKYWIGTVLSVEDVKKLGFVHSNPTGIQVGASINAAIKYILKNKGKGLLDPEDFDHEFIIENSKKYLGNIFHGYV